MFRSAIKYLALLINLFFSLMYIFGLLAAVVPSNKFVWFSYFGLFFTVKLIVLYSIRFRHFLVVPPPQMVLSHLFWIVNPNIAGSK